MASHKGLEQALLELLRHPNARIRHCKTIAGPLCSLFCRRLFNGKSDGPPTWREFYRVAEDINQDLADTQRIPIKILMADA